MEGTNLLIGNTTQGEQIFMNGKYFGTNPLLRKIVYGPDQFPSRYTCFNIPPIDDTMIHCKTSAGDGTQMKFTISIGYGQHAYEIVSTDMYNYPTSPEVSSVTGCTNGNKRCY
jgi:hypothetical protein